MTRRIAMTILLAVWVTLLAMGAVAYLTTREALLANLKTWRQDHAAPSTQQATANPTYQQMVENSNDLLTHLRFSLGSTIVFGALLAASVARWTARRSLRPLRKTAEIVASIDERTLHKRIEVDGFATELEPVVSKLNEMLARLDESSQRRQQFLADASHELRTPVAALMTSIEVALRRPREANEYKEALSTCLVDAKLLNRLVEALLTQVRSGKASQSRSKTGLERSGERVLDDMIDVASLVEECASAVAPLAEAKSIHLSTDGPANLPMRTQPMRLRSILVNLLGNAVQYNRPGGSIHVTYRVHQGFVEIAVSDTGVGIARDQIRKIFEPFYRLDKAHSSSGNLGLGLYLVQSHIESLGGECEVQSEVGQGTVFRLRLPGVVGMVMTPKLVHH